MVDGIRAFVALDLDDAALERVAASLEHARRLKSAPRAGWSSPEKLHVTLRFLGNVAPDTIPAIASAMHETLDGTIAPEVELAEVDGFSRARAARVVYLAIRDPSGETTALEARLGPRLDALGYPSDHGRWVPHLTLARCRVPADLRPWIAELGEPRLGKATIVSCTLFRSTLGPGGSRYEPLDRVVFVPRHST